MPTSRGPELHHVSTPIHGRFLVEYPAGGAPYAELIGFHGYGETAADHLGALRRVPGADGWLRCAVQALHPFYRGRDREVVASWMTRLDRELAIDDNVGYVTRVLAALEGLAGRPRCRVVVGFSQGVAMAYRAAARVAAPCHGLVVLGGDVPPELGRDELAALPPVLVGRGWREEWYSQEKLDEDLARLREAGAHVETCLFDGGHEWAPPFLEAAGRFLATRLG